MWSLRTGTPASLPLCSNCVFRCRISRRRVPMGGSDVDGADRLDAFEAPYAALEVLDKHVVRPLRQQAREVAELLRKSVEVTHQFVSPFRNVYQRHCGPGTAPKLRHGRTGGPPARDTETGEGSALGREYPRAERSWRVKWCTKAEDWSPGVVMIACAPFEKRHSSASELPKGSRRT